MSVPARVTVILPCRNEAACIRSCLETVLANDYSKEHLELLIVDGLSEDGTRNIISEFVERYPWMRMLDNVGKVTPTGLNLGIQHATGDIIIRMDAHNEYPPHYISRLVEWLNTSGADNVGGVTYTRAANETFKARAIALGLSHPFGVGNAHFRIGVSQPTWVDTVPFGCYRKELFEKIGLFDVELVRNQDDEFNHRLIKHGGRILLVQEVASRYLARDSLSKLWRMYYQYGYFKPLVARKIGTVMTARQLIPSLFVLTLILTASAAPWFLPMRMILAVLVACYATFAVFFSAHVSFHKGVRCGLWLALVFLVLHLSYGCGFLMGMLDFLVLRKKGIQDPSALSLSR